MELIDYVRMVRRHWVWVLVLTLLGLGASAMWSALAPKTYSATAQIFVGTSFRGDGTDANVSAQSASQFALDRMNSYAQLSTSTIVSTPVVKALGLTFPPNDLRKHVKVTAQTKTVLLKVTATDGSPRQAAALANTSAGVLATTIQKLESSGTKGTPPVTATVVSRASVPTTPSSPNKKLALALGMIVGLGLGLLAASLREQAARRPASPVTTVQPGAAPGAEPLPASGVRGSGWT